MLVSNNILQWKKPARKTHRAQSRMGLHDERNFHCVTLLPRGSEFMAHCVISRIVQPSDVLNHLVFQYIKLVANINLLMQ